MTHEPCDPHVRLCVECLRAWIDRKPPPPEPALDERDWTEFELARIGRELAEAGHA